MAHVYCSERLRRRASAVVRERRAALGLTLDALAKEAGVSERTVRYIEKGERMPTLEVLIRLAATLDIPLASLVCPDEAAS
jgi:transcriptional regulator with XRE-family HTH domain